MHNQHPGLTGMLAEARMIERRLKAAHERLGGALGCRAADDAGDAPLVAAGAAAGKGVGATSNKERVGAGCRPVSILAGRDHTGGHGWRVYG